MLKSAQKRNKHPYSKNFEMLESSISSTKEKAGEYIVKTTGSISPNSGGLHKNRG